MTHKMAPVGDVAESQGKAASEAEEHEVEEHEVEHNNNNKTGHKVLD